MRKSEKQKSDSVLKFSDHKRKRAGDLEEDLNALFRLPLTEFTGARNALATQLKKSGRGEDAALVKGMAKPSVSAWAVNQLYWNHREAFDQLIASGERFHKAQKSGKVADMRTALDARREALTQLSDLAASLLRDAGNNPAPDTIRRVTTTLEGISAYASRSDGPRPGRLSRDVDPPGFESLGAFAATKQEASAGRQEAAARKQAPGITQSRDSKRKLAETQKAQLAEAKVSLQDAKKSLTEARATAQRVDAAQKKADAEAKKAEKERRDAEQRLEKAKAAAEEAARTRAKSCR